MRLLLIAVLTVGVAASARAECTVVMWPTAEMLQEQNGKPDHHDATTCGGGHDEYGDKIKPWPCLIWKYDGKGYVVFSRIAKAGVSDFLVTGCGTPDPRIAPVPRTLWALNACRDDTAAQKPCNDLGFSVDPETWEPPPDIEAEGISAFLEWHGKLLRVCRSQSEARAEAKKCKAKPEPAEPVDRATKEL